MVAGGRAPDCAGYRDPLVVQKHASGEQQRGELLCFSCFFCVRTFCCECRSNALADLRAGHRDIYIHDRVFTS